MKQMKKLIVLAVAVLASASLFAQTDSLSRYDDDDMGRRIIINKWYQNWGISAKIGTQAYLGEYVTDVYDIKDWWNLPAIDINLSKWGTQNIGLDLGFTFSPMKTLYHTGASSNEPFYASFAKPDDKIYKNGFNIARGNMGNAYISVLFNVSNMFSGYEKERIYNLVASLGGGLMFPLSETKYKDICASFNAGLINRFTLTDRLCLDLAVRGTLHDDMFNGVSYYTSNDRRNLSVDATIGATVGVTYRFDMPSKKARKTNRSNTGAWTTVDDVVVYTGAYKEVESTVAEMEQTVIEKEAAVKEIEKTANEAKAEAENLKQTLIVYQTADFIYNQMVNFTIDKWDISNREKVIVSSAAEVIKSHPEVKFSLDGYADIQTSNPKHNQFLSEQRVNAVYDMLVNEFGVNPDQLVKSAHGGVDYLFFNDEQCSRSVIITALKK